MDRFISYFIFMFKVLDKVTGERVIVEFVDSSKHLHPSGSEFTADQLATLPTKKAKVEKVEEVVEAPKAKGKK
jgi:hypothetical protein